MSRPPIQQQNRKGEKKLPSSVRPKGPPINYVISVGGGQKSPVLCSKKTTKRGAGRGLKIADFETTEFMDDHQLGLINFSSINVRQHTWTTDA